MVTRNKKGLLNFYGVTGLIFLTILTITFFSYVGNIPECTNEPVDILTPLIASLLFIMFFFLGYLC